MHDSPNFLPTIKVEPLVNVVNIGGFTLPTGQYYLFINKIRVHEFSKLAKPFLHTHVAI